MSSRFSSPMTNAPMSAVAISFSGRSWRVASTRLAITSSAATLTGPDEVASTDWGLGTLTFDAETFPTGWTATLGRCGAIPGFGLRADPWWEGMEAE